MHIPLAAKRRTITADMVAEGEDSVVSNSKDRMLRSDWRSSISSVRLVTDTSIPEVGKSK